MQIANRHMKKKCSISLHIREMQVSTIMLLSHTYQNACYQTEKIPSIGKGLVRGESLCTVGVDINWYSQYARQFLKKLKKTVLLHYPTSLFLSIYLEKMKH